MSTASDFMYLRLRGVTPAPVVGVRFGTFALASLFIGVWLVSLSRGIFDPIGFDQALYQYITDRVMLGQCLYTDVWDQNGPGIIGVHWLSTVLVGRTPIALRVFDAVWQSATIAALGFLAVRDERRWQAGWLAAILYILAYYGLGYVHTAQREGFAVLPLLLALHALIPTQVDDNRRTWLAARYFTAGVMFFLAFIIKPPLGLCFGIIWLLHARAYVGASVGAACSRDPLQPVGPPLQRARPGVASGEAGWGSEFSVRELCRSAEKTPLLALSLGFLISAAAAAGLLHHLGWWDGFWRVLTRQDVGGYIRGPQLIRELMPQLTAGLVCVAIAVVAAYGRWARSTAGSPLHLRGLAVPFVAGAAIFGLLLTVQQWPQWQQAFLKTAGLLVPAAGAMLLAKWGQRSRAWQMAALLALASFAAIVWQGHFALYQFPPLLAFAAYVAAVEIVERFSRFGESQAAGRIWTMVCVGLAIHLAVSTWGWTMTYYGTSPYALSGTTLAEHYTKVTANKPSFPTYETTAIAAARVRELTGQNDPIVCLIDEPRLYYLSQRPPAYPLLRTQSCYSNLFPGLFEAIRTKQPKVLLARLPAARRGTVDPKAAEPAVLADLENCFGPSSRVVRENYNLTEIINGDVCILQPKGAS